MLQNYYFHNLLGNLLEFSMYIFKLKIKTFISCFPIYMPFISLSCAFALVRSSSIMLNKISKERIFLSHS